MKYLVLALLAGCVHLQHVEPQTRTQRAQAAADVEVESFCQTGAGSLSQDWGTSYGHGVVISERHVLTAAHIVACPGIPEVYVTLGDGQRRHMTVIREAGDVAKLELSSADSFGLDLAPPKLGVGNEGGPAYMGNISGVFTGSSATDFRSRKGESGMGVYNGLGQLVGLNSRGNTILAPVDETWLANT